MKHNFKPYGKYIDVDNKKMCVSVSGNGDEVILLLSGLNSASPIIEMKALTNYLKDKYTVVTIEYLGYGMSDNASKERTIENIVDNIHEAIQKLGYFEYSIAGHSIAGIYCLMYINKYINEVKNFIGIDTYAPQLIDYTDAMDTMLQRKLKINESHSIILPIKTRYYAKKMLKKINDYKYNQEDLNAYAEMSVKALKHGSVINELQNAKTNFRKMQHAKFPKGVNVLLLLASDTKAIFPKWIEWHKSILNSSGRIKVIKGTHLLHLEKPKSIANEIDIFISNPINPCKK